ncbi:MAG: sigma-70 family RNA polymerase sigma factor [Gemmataceae bacterium]
MTAHPPNVETLDPPTPALAALPTRRAAVRPSVNHWAAVDPDEVIPLPRFQPLPYLTEARLFAMAQAGDRDARNALWVRNARLALTVANQHRLPHDLLPDIVQEALLRLPRAIELYDVHRYNAFSTYAWHWLRNGAHHCLWHCRFRTRIPAHLYREYCRFRHHVRHEAHQDESREYLHQLREWHPERYARFRRLTAVHNAEPLAPKHDRIAAPSPVGRLDDAYDEAAVSLRAFLTRLRPRSADVLRRRFGLDGHPQQTLRQIAEVYHLTRERVRQIEGAALNKLRRYIDAAVVANPDHPLADLCLSANATRASTI